MLSLWFAEVYTSIKYTYFISYNTNFCPQNLMDCVKRIWYLSPMRSAKVQASLRIRAVSPEPPLLAHTSSESRGTFRQKARSLAPLNGWACAVKFCHDGMLEDTNSLDGAFIFVDFTAHFRILTHGIYRSVTLFSPANQNAWNKHNDEELELLHDVILPDMTSYDQPLQQILNGTLFQVRKNLCTQLN